MALTFDVAVIGGGVVGCAVLRRFALNGLDAILLEKEPDLLSGASKGNSGILHTGFDAPAGSLEVELVQRGYREYRRIASRLNLPMLETGAMVVAWSAAEAARLDAVERHARGNGVDDVRRLTRAEVLAREPHLSPRAVEALLVPGEHVIDPWSAPLAYALQAIANGGEVRRGTEVLGGEYDGAGWTLDTSTGPVRARWTVNCAGLYGDLVHGRLAGPSPFRIKPRKGQFVVFDKAASALLRTTILAIPDERTKGIVLARTAFGNLLVGPTAEEQEDRRRAAVDAATLERLIDQAVAIVPGLEGMAVTATYAGLRPATESKEYRISLDRGLGLITVGGIRSTGLTSALGIAEHVAEMHDGARSSFESDLRPAPPAEVAGGGFALPGPRTAQESWPLVPNLAEHAERDWAQPGAGEIVCHCELVTRREIEAALSGPLPARDLGGLKRRTRAGMGRCQGFYCHARIASLTAGRLAVPLAMEAPVG